MLLLTFAFLLGLVTAVTSAVVVLLFITIWVTLALSVELSLDSLCFCRIEIVTEDLFLLLAVVRELLLQEAVSAFFFLTYVIVGL